MPVDVNPDGKILYFYILKNVCFYQEMFPSYMVGQAFSIAPDKIGYPGLIHF